MECMECCRREDLVGDALQILYDKHGVAREDLHIQTKSVCSRRVIAVTF